LSRCYTNNTKIYSTW